MISARLQGVALVDGRRVDVDLDRDGGIIVAVTPAGSTAPPGGADLHPLPEHLLLPAPAEPHAHLDKALTYDRVPNPAGDLPGAVAGWHAYRVTVSVDDMVERARRAALLSVAAGATALRTHVDVGQGIGLRAVEALLALRRELAPWLDLQVVALVSLPLVGAQGAPQRALLGQALELGVDVVGGAPHIDADPRATMDVCLAAARDAGVPLDLHTDENLDTASVGLRDLAEEVVRTGFSGRVTASHCVSLGMQGLEVQAATAALVAEAGVAVVANPQTNLYLQGRQHPMSTPRGLTGLRSLLGAGATVAGGGDNMRDPFNPLGRGDPLEVASLLVTAGHLPIDEAYRAVSSSARLAMGLAPVAIEPGSPAELLAIKAESLAAAIASSTEDRLVVHQGRVVARTVVSRELAAPPVASGGHQKAVSSRSPARDGRSTVAP